MFLKAFNGDDQIRLKPLSTIIGQFPRETLLGDFGVSVVPLKVVIDIDL
jgi:hypothetical protein